MDSRVKEIRENEKNSHIEIYSKEALYHTESWLKKPIKTVEDIIPLLCDLKKVQAKQEYDIPRGGIVSHLSTNVITYVGKKR